MIVPSKLKKGDEVRIIAPSRSMVILKEDCINFAISLLTKTKAKGQVLKAINFALINRINI